MTEDISRRVALKRMAALSVGASAAVGLGYAGSTPAAALDATDEFLADDVRVERNDGTIRAVTIAPELQLRWKNFGGGIESVESTLSAALAGQPGFDVLFDGTVSDPEITVDGDSSDSTDGSQRLRFDRHDLTAIGSDVTAEDFGSELGPGDSETTTVELTLRVDIIGSQSETVTAVETASFDVTLHNPAGEATTTGRANPAAE